MRQVRGIERAVEARTDPEADVVRGYRSAVRSAWTDDGRPPLEASGQGHIFTELHELTRILGIPSFSDKIAQIGKIRVSPNQNSSF